MTREPSINSDPLEMSFHGRVLEHLGIQMYQTPVNALAEFVANAWDADATKVHIFLPNDLDSDAKIVIADNGNGMSHEECAARFLTVGYNRRGDDPDAKSKFLDRPVLGRKGIGKFAGFGIADEIRIDTISGTERKIFVLKLKELNSGLYSNAKPITIPVVSDAPEPDERIDGKGTVITLSQLRLKQRIRDDFPRSMARRFLILQNQANFEMTVNGNSLPEESSDDIQYSFPRDYQNPEKPENLRSEDDWGIELLANGREVKWRFQFHKDTIGLEELRGVTIFAKGKLVQSAFAFHSDRTFSGEHGLQYLTGQVQADFLDSLNEDIITTERQRVNWENEDALPLLEWGQRRLKQLLRIWSQRRGESRRLQVERKLTKFSNRLDKLPSHEGRTVRSALNKLAGIPTMSDQQFEDLADAVLTAWEQGRLRVLIDEISTTELPSAEQFLQLLLEQEVLSALNIAETITTKIQILKKLLDHVEGQTLENPLRDFIAENPWLISPELETYAKETALKTVIKTNLKQYIPEGMHNKRADLLLKSGAHMVLVEFMKPGAKLDWDHLTRYELYYRALLAYFKANTASGIDTISGYIVADYLDNDAAFIEKCQALKREGLVSSDWIFLFTAALDKWKIFFNSLSSRQQEDERIKALKAMID